MKARLPKGMGGGPQNMQSMIKQAQKMQEDMERVQAELEDLIVAAVNEAIKTVDSKSQQAMSKVTSGISMPGLF